jgi:hypothetical protein
MGEAPSLLSLVSREICASDTGRLRVRNGSTRKAAGGRIVSGPGELVVGSPEFVELEPQLWAAGVGPLGRRGSLVRGTCTCAAVAHRHGRRNPIVGRRVDRHLSVPEFSVVTVSIDHVQHGGPVVLKQREEVLASGRAAGRIPV